MIFKTMNQRVWGTSIVIGRGTYLIDPEDGTIDIPDQDAKFLAGMKKWKHVRSPQPEPEIQVPAAPPLIQAVETSDDSDPQTPVEPAEVQDEPEVEPEPEPKPEPKKASPSPNPKKKKAKKK